MLLITAVRQLYQSFPFNYKILYEPDEVEVQRGKMAEATWQNVRDAPTPKWDAITMQTLHDFDLNQMLERTGGPYQTMKNQHNK